MWAWVGNLLRCQLEFSSPVSLLLRCLEGLHANVKHIALSATIHTFHTIWMARNGIKFNNARISLHAAIIKVKTATHTSVTMSRVVVPAGSVAVHMLQDLQLAPIYQAPPCIIPVCWKAPSFNWVKVNTDDSLVGAATACGAIFRDAKGAFLGGFSCKLDCTYVLHAELLAIIIAIEQAHARGVPCLLLYHSLFSGTGVVLLIFVSLDVLAFFSFVSLDRGLEFTRGANIVGMSSVLFDVIMLLIQLKKFKWFLV
jgi:hypothetical protein